MSTYYTAGSMPLAFPQEDFLVCFVFKFLNKNIVTTHRGKSGEGENFIQVGKFCRENLFSKNIGLVFIAVCFQVPKFFSLS